MRALQTIGCFAIVLALAGCTPPPPNPAVVAQLHADVNTLQGMVELHAIQHGVAPTFVGTAQEQWAWLTDGIEAGVGLPANPLSPPLVSASVRVVNVPGADGTVVDPGEAGWVWNEADRRIHAAGIAALSAK